VVSLTVNVVVQVSVLPLESVAVTVIVCGPFPTMVPAAGLCVNVTVPPQLSEAVAPDVTSGTGASQFSSAEAEVGAGQLTSGGVLSVTVNVVVQVSVLPLGSVAVTVIV
jgi:hypothetical protein